MKTQRGRRFAVYSILTAIAALAGVSYGLRDRLIERYYLLRFESEEEETKKLALAEALADMGSLAAVPEFLEILGTGGPSWETPVRLALGKIASQRPRAVQPVLIRALENESLLVSGEAADALVSLGMEAVPALVDALRVELPQVRFWSAYALGEIGRKRRKKGESLAPAVVALEDLLERDRNVEVRFESARALKKLKLGRHRPVEAAER